jgi:hypothetical protein
MADLPLDQLAHGPYRNELEHSDRGGMGAVCRPKGVEHVGVRKSG